MKINPGIHDGLKASSIIGVKEKAPNILKDLLSFDVYLEKLERSTLVDGSHLLNIETIE